MIGLTAFLTAWHHLPNPKRPQDPDLSDTDVVHEQGKRERGSILILLIGLCLILLLVATVVITVSSVYLERQRLQALADQTASAAAQRVEGITAETEQEAHLVLTPAGVLATSQEFLTETGALAEFENLTLSPASGVSGGSTAQVFLSSTARPPIASVVLPEGVTVTVTGRARVTVDR